MVRRKDLTTFEFKPAKFRELVCYIAQQCADDPTFGSVKLNKILFYADFAAYRQLREPITGATYRKLSEGPAPRELLPARRALIDSGRIEMEERTYFGFVQKRPVPLPGSTADTSLFSERELDVVDETIAFFLGKSAREVSDYSHREPGWMLTEDLEDIPYQTAHLSAEPLDQETELHALEIARELIASRPEHG
ncbi:MAG: DUF4065 domain-containing protein [Chloroflexi bacterium]|nr:DUF4065 domain-containing protein [Chloroflexota bacterium]MYC00924.1 DUF4065 domain-containing protein [Chloroflexota bacterium]